MSPFYEREKRLKPCLVDTCPTPVLTGGPRKRCEPCQRALWAVKAAQQRLLHPKPRKRYRARVEPFQESPAVIEAAFTAALAQIKARPREEPVLRWTSPLARL